jgi:hypothetical protein
MKAARPTLTSNSSAFRPGIEISSIAPKKKKKKETFNKRTKTN